MAVFMPLGYITTFNALTVTNPSGSADQLPTTYTTGGMTVRPRIIILPNGVKVHYDGSSDAPSLPGKVVQELVDTTGTAGALIDTFGTWLGDVGDLVLTVVSSGGGTKTAEGILVDVEDITPVQGNRDKVWIRLTWEMLEDWA